MKNNKKKIEIVIALALGTALLLLLFFAAGTFKAPSPPKHTDTGGANITSAQDAQTAALKIALGWHTDAVLSSLVSNTASGGGPISDWQFIYIAPSAPGKGFMVDVSTEKVMNFKEIDYTGTGAPLPDTIISQGEAIRRIHQLRGYGTSTILDIQAVYDAVKKTWFWAAKTPHGTVSIDASK